MIFRLTIPLSNSCWMLLGIIVVTLSGCNRPKVIEINHRFSYNVAKVPYWFPDDIGNLTLTQREVIRQYGNPNFIRFWWNRSGRLIHSSDLSGRAPTIREEMANLKRTWIYLRPKLEIEFRKTGGFEKHPLTDIIELVCLYGDPSDRKGPRINAQGVKVEHWRWIEHGIMIELHDEKEYKRKYFQGTGTGTDVLK